MRTLVAARSMAAAATALVALTGGHALAARGPAAGTAGTPDAAGCDATRPALRSPEILTAQFRFWPGDRDCTIPALTVTAGSRLTHRNADFAAHDVRSVALRPGTSTPLFASDLNRYLTSGEVRGVAALPPGRYAFYCTIHPPRTNGSGMRGELVVEGSR